MSETEAHEGRARSRGRDVARVARVAAAFVGFFALLFAARFLARGHLIPRLDQECHIGGIGVELLAHGIRFPLLAYAPNEYDNGSFFSGLVTAGFFAVLGRSYLTLKLVTHTFAAMGATAAAWLLWGCLDDLRVTSRRARWAAVAALVVAFVSAPRLVTVTSLYAVGTHTEGAAINTLLLALFAWRIRRPGGLLVFAYWCVVGLSLYLNKATVLVLLVTGSAEVLLSWRRGAGEGAPAGLRARAREWAIVLAGLALGLLPELLVVGGRGGLGWLMMSSKASRHAANFPHAFLNSLTGLTDGHADVLAAFFVTIVVSCALAWRSRGPTLALVVGTSVVHLALLTVMAQEGPDRYVIYGHASFVVLLGALVGLAVERGSARWGARAGALLGFATVAGVALLARPDAVTSGVAMVATLARDRDGGVCSWRFAEGFLREAHHGLAAQGIAAEAHQLARCRSLSEEDQVLDCVAGIARELTWRRKGRVTGAPPDGLTERERLAYAFGYGAHRRGDEAPCADFHDTALQSACRGAVTLDCLSFGDLYSGLTLGRHLGRPRCDVAEPPMDGFWAALRRDLAARRPEERGGVSFRRGIEELQSCGAILDACYP